MRILESWVAVSCLLLPNWNVDNWGHFGELLEGIAAACTFCALLVAGVYGLIKYRQQLRLGAADLLLRMEPEHREIYETFLELQLAKPEDLISQAMAAGKEKRSDVIGVPEKLCKIDRCLRFFYSCTVLDHLGVEEIAIIRGYYYYLLELSDPHKEQLHAFLRKYYPMLFKWLAHNRVFLKHFKETGRWRPLGMRLQRKFGLSS